MIKMNKSDFLFIDKEIRSKTFGILNTMDQNGFPHTSGVLFGVSKPSSKFTIYIVTSIKYRKAKNIQKNPNVSLIIPFPHYYMRFVPSSTITITGKAEIKSFDNGEVLEIFMKKRILRLITQHLTEEEKKEMAIIKIKPNPKILCYGIGISMWKLRKGHSKGGYSVKIPKEKLH
jgi:hypothetical protein